MWLYLYIHISISKIKFRNDNLKKRMGNRWNFLWIENLLQSLSDLSMFSVFYR